jgi:hypothetical protein
VRRVGRLAAPLLADSLLVAGCSGPAASSASTKPSRIGSVSAPASTRHPRSPVPRRSSRTVSQSSGADCWVRRWEALPAWLRGTRVGRAPVAVLVGGSGGSVAVSVTSGSAAGVAADAAGVSVTDLATSVGLVILGVGGGSAELVGEFGGGLF